MASALSWPLHWCETGGKSFSSPSAPPALGGFCNLLPVGALRLLPTSWPFRKGSLPEVSSQPLLCSLALPPLLASFFPHLCVSLVSCCLPPASPLSLFQMLPPSSSLNASPFLSDTLLLLYLSVFALSLLLSSTSRLWRRGGDDGLGAGVL